MSEADVNPPLGPDDHTPLLLIVTGSHLRAEVADRPLAYRLQQAIHDWIETHEELLATDISPVVCSDIWYINHNELQSRPTICVGGPGVNALSQYYAQALPENDQAEQQVIIQIDPEFTDLRVIIWGTNHELTAKGVELFVQDYLDGFLQAVATQVEPRVD